MLELRPTCENCNKELPPDSAEAMICTYECTFCRTCVETVLMNVCPNCTGGFVPRPIRPRTKLKRNPPSYRIVYNPVDLKRQKELILKYKDVDPAER